MTEAKLVKAVKKGVGRLVDCSQADDRRVIALVRERPLLFARNNMPVASYYNKVKSLWTEVARQMDWTVAEVRRKWSHIRNSYSRHLRNEMYGARTGKGRMVSRWYLADELEFLREHMATDTRPSGSSSYSPHKYLKMNIEEESQSNECFNLWPSPPPGGTRAEHVDIKQEPCEVHEDTSSNAHSFSPDENSSYFQFFRGIYNDYQELPAQKQRLFKRQCLNFLHDMLDEEEYQSPTMCSQAINLTTSEDERDLSSVMVTSITSIVPN